ncbi:sigma-70 family RNA polymerase sigma factor [Cetobacterium sp. 8H]|uniref:sigma-70 family RNA polymerase sigma factor n=1 Tax=Cetobacterium sp. 8H TaxID=2759681 RepID=UPI00163C2D79|nr:sigma-70 family RNA polymerase sigma factor [Cetobacterium sp. 8H]MBC2850815.1 sigma-70 family RNA polymerase sigma factor [Cetobacterium sp. 8H]
MIEKEDIILAQNGNEESIEKIIREYQGTIYRNNRSFFLKGGDSDDLMQEGFIGLIKAIKSYDETRNACFSTFANLCIRRQMITAVKNYNSDKYKNLNLAMQGDGYSNHEESVRYNSPSLGFYSPEDIFLGKELVNLLTDFLSENLSELEKKVFKHLCQEYSYIEIAELLNEPPKKIDNTIQRIKKKILLYLSSYTH